jgi:hypothetical protein
MRLILRYLGAGGVVKLVLDENECMGQLDAGDETNGEYTLEGST